MIAVALVPIARDFDATVAQTGWLIAGLYLASAVAQPTMGRLADLFGPRRVFVAALLLVALAGLLGNFAPTLVSLIVVRVLLGVGTSGAYPSSMRMFRVQADRFGMDPPRRAMSVLSMTALGTTALGPLVGGALTNAYGWHAIFTVNIPLALISAGAVMIWGPADPPLARITRRDLAQIDLGGIALFTLALLCAILFLMNVQRPEWLALAGAIVLGAVFVRHSLKRADPFIDVRMLLHNVPLSVTYARQACVLLIVYTMVYGFAQWLESSVGLSSAQAGLMLIPVSLVGILSSFTGARTRGLRVPFIISIGATFAGGVALLFVNAGTPVVWIALAGALFGLPQGMFSTATQAAIYVQAPPDHIGTAAGLQRTAGYIGAIGAASLLGILFGSHATDAGFHALAIVASVLGGALFIFTLVDPTLPRGRV